MVGWKTLANRIQLSLWLFLIPALILVVIATSTVSYYILENRPPKSIRDLARLVKNWNGDVKSTQRLP